MKPIKLPKTNTTCYISGISALNIPAPEKTSGDWHFRHAFFAFKDQTPEVDVSGEGKPVNTNKIYGNYGVHECSAGLRKSGLKVPPRTAVYSANHYRAILDLLYYCLAIRHQYPHSVSIDDWLDTSEQKEQLFKKANEMSSVLAPEDARNLALWIRKQRQRGYRS